MRCVLLAALLLLLAACTTPTVGPQPTPMPDTSTRPADFALDYEWRAGSMPPPHHSEYSLQIQSDGSGQIVFSPDYPGEGIPVWTEPFTLDAAKLDALYQTLHENGLFTTTWEARENPPVGGDYDWMSVTATGQQVNVGPFVIESQVAAYEAMANAVEATVPDDIWIKLREQRQEYEDNYQP